MLKLIFGREIRQFFAQASPKSSGGRRRNAHRCAGADATNVYGAG